MAVVVANWVKLVLLIITPPPSHTPFFRFIHQPFHSSCRKILTRDTSPAYFSPRLEDSHRLAALCL